MIKLFKDALKISYNNIIMATPLLLFLLILNMYLMVAKTAVQALPSTILLLLTLLLMISAFLSGWLYMIRTAVDGYINNSQIKDLNNSYTLLREFPTGISEYIKPFLGFTILYILFADFSFITVYHIGMKVIGSFGISLQQFINATESPVAMQALLEDLTKAQLIKINYWYLLSIVSVQIFTLITLFWPIELMYSTKNPLIAFCKSIVRVFTKPQIILLFIGINIINLVLMIFNYIAIFNPITYFIMTLIFFSFIVYVFVLLFLYYETKIKDNSDSITDSNGQE